MAKYEVDVKAFISVTVEAANENEARKAADEFVQTLEPHEHYVGGYNMEQEAQGLPGRILTTGSFDIDGESYVDGKLDEERVDD